MAGALYRDEGEEAFTLMHRFHDADDDERRWYTTVLSNADGTPDEAGARKLVAGLIDAYQQGEQVQRIERIDLRRPRLSSSSGCPQLPAST